MKTTGSLADASGYDRPPRIVTRSVSEVGTGRLSWLAVCGLLLFAVGLGFGQSAQFGFVFDDGGYVVSNRHILGGVTWDRVHWAFVSSHMANWHPLTWISLMLDCGLYRLNPAGFHVTNVLIYAATVVLLFLVLRQMTGRLWPSALAAAIFAVHPLRAESVAWVTERKDLLSGLFFVLTLGAYVFYVRRPFSLARYAAVMACLALGLMSKATVVTVPCLLLLLDYWPLGRFPAYRRVRETHQALAEDPSVRSTSLPDGPKSTGGFAVRFTHPTALPGGPTPSGGFAVRFTRPTALRLVAEKLPLLGLVAVAIRMTMWAQSSAIAFSGQYTLSWRLRYIPIAYVVYLGKFFCPVDLAAVYPRPGLEIPLWKTCGALAVLLGITAAAVSGGGGSPISWSVGCGSWEWPCR